MWIFGSSSKDLSFLVLPGLAVGAILLGTDLDPSLALALGFVSMALIDSGHVYATAFRTYFNRSERQSSAIYWLTPLLIVAICTSWYYWHWPYFWPAVVYATFWHNIRQFYGFSRWYQKLERRSCRASSFFVYTLTLLPFAMFHFRPGARAEVLSTQDLFLFANYSIYNATFYIYGAVIIAWIVFEFYQYRQLGRLETGRMLATLTPAYLYGAGFLLGTNLLEVLAPIIVAHGVAYLAIIAFSLNRTHEQRYRNFRNTLLLVTGVAFTLGFLETTLVESFVMSGRVNYATHRPELATCFLIALSLTPLLSHYVIDAYIWTIKHREAALVYQTVPAQLSAEVRIDWRDAS